jgi:hypothetical protein
MKRRRYQYGSLTKKNNRLSEDDWQFRFYETTPASRNALPTRLWWEVGSMKMPLRTSLPQMGAKRHSARGVWDACNHI